MSTDQGYNKGERVSGNPDRIEGNQCGVLGTAELIKQIFPNKNGGKRFWVHKYLNIRNINIPIAPL
jgi:hypothetical protein